MEVIDLLASNDLDQARRNELGEEFSRIYFENPWVDPELPPLIATLDDRIVGFLGITPRVMQYGDRRLRVAVSSNFTVAPSAPEKHRPFIAARMIKTMIGGPQDLSLADGATDVSRRIWERCGGSIAPVMGLDWFHTARPARGIWELARRGLDTASPLSRAATLGTETLDLIGASFTKRLAQNAATPSPLDLDEVVTAVNMRIAAPIKPVAQRDWIDWLLRQSSRLAIDGKIRTGAIKNAEGGLAGWFISIMSRDRVADILQIEAPGTDAEAVIGAAIADARGAGAALIRGHARMAHLAAYRRHFCLLNSGRWVLTHSRDPKLLRPFNDGTAWVSMLDGERWIGNFQR